MEMKAAILAAQEEPLVIDSVQLPSDLSPGQVLVKVHYTSVCGSQVAMIEGKRGKDPYLPHLLGHEGSGTVEEVGPGVRTVAKSDRVVLHCGCRRRNRIRNTQLSMAGQTSQCWLGHYL